jgi:hypothetical protein
MKSTWIGFMVFALCGSFSTLGQTLLFTGGSGSGTVARKSAQITISGSTDLVPFKGGTGMGNSSAKSILIQLGSTQTLTFLGGAGDGSNSVSSGSVSLSGLNQNFNFTGGSGDGSAKNQTQLLSLEGSSYLSIPFYGGSGRGNTSASTSLVSMTGTNIGITFNGSTGHGSNARQSLVLLMSGTPYQYLFTGGTGRGNIQFRSQKLSLSGVISPGFARVAQSAISDFRAIPKNNRIRLNWRAENQEILDHFVVEKSNDGVDFNAIGFVASGSDHSTGLFSFPHSGNSNETEYFRLLEIFKDSSFSYSSVLKVATVTDHEIISLYPNPVRDKLNVSLPSSERAEMIQIFDYSGQLVKDVAVMSSEKVEINTEDLPAGLYWLETGNESGKNRIRFTRL